MATFGLLFPNRFVIIFDQKSLYPLKKIGKCYTAKQTRYKNILWNLIQPPILFILLV